MTYEGVQMLLHEKSIKFNQLMVKLITTIVAIFLTNYLYADERKIQLSINDQKIGSALMVLGEQADVQIMSDDAIGSRMSKVSLNGEYTLEAALNALLDDTGLIYEFTSDYSVLIKEGKTATKKSSDAGSTMKIIKNSQLDEENDNSSDESVEEDEGNQVVIVGKRVIKRNRIDTIEPTLVYDADYFQRFEPTSLRDLLKRIPGVTFNEFIGVTGARNGDASDINASEASFRSLSQQNAQILINGRRIPGFNNQNNVALNRIPAEMIKQVQVIRSPSAAINSQGAAMTINLILKDGSNIENQINWRAGFVSQAGEFGKRLSIDYADQIDNFSFFVQAEIVDQTQISRSSNIEVGSGLFDFNFDTFTGALIDFSEVITDDKTETIQANATWLMESGAEWSWDLFLIEGEAEDVTQGTEILIREDNSLETRNGGLAFPFFQTTESQHIGTAYNDIYGDNEYNIAVSYDRSITDFSDGNNVFDRDELQLNISNEYSGFSADHSLLVGIDANLIESTEESSFRDALQEEDFLAAFAVYEIKLTEDLDLQLGGRYESRDFDARGRTEIFVFASDETDQATDSFLNRTAFSTKISGFNPSVNFRYKLNDQNDIRLSLARTIRLPDLRQLDSSTNIGTGRSSGRRVVRLETGGSDLENEESTGVDLGYDYSFKTGIIGVNFFYRRIKNLIDEQTVRGRNRLQQRRPDLVSIFDDFRNTINGTLVNDFSSEVFALDADDVILNFSRNIQGIQRVKGVEVDFSIPMSIFSLPNMSLTGNVSYSEEDSPTFSNNGEFVFNIAFDHLIESWGITYGASFNQVDDIETSFVDPFEETFTFNEGSQLLDVFIQKRINDGLIVRLSVENALNDSDKTISDVTFLDGLGNVESSSVSTFTSEADPLYSLTFRGSF